jgi:pyruvate dehydrogenase E1 component beta subunit
VADNDWLHCGLSAEIAARVSAKSFGKLKKPVERIGFAECQCPTQRHLENEFYPNAGKLVKKTEDMLDIKHCDLSGEQFYAYEDRFRGPF